MADKPLRGLAFLRNTNTLLKCQPAPSTRIVFTFRPSPSQSPSSSGQSQYLTDPCPPLPGLACAKVGGGAFGELQWQWFAEPEEQRGRKKSLTTQRGLAGLVRDPDDQRIIPSWSYFCCAR